MEGGGAQAAAMRISQGLRGRGHHAETWFLYLKRPTYIGGKGVRVLLRYPPRHIRDYIHIFIKLVRDLKRESPDGVITFTHYSNILGQLAAWLAGIGCRVASQRNPSWSYPMMARWLDSLLGTLGLFKGNVMVSEAVKSTFSDYSTNYKKGVCVVHNGIDFMPSPLRPEQSRASFSLPINVPLVVTIGRLAEQKNQAVLIRALLELPHIHLAIAGDGELRHKLQTIVKQFGLHDRVHFLGEIPPTDVVDLLNAANIFAIPSRFEGLSNALLEAISAGLPVIASDIPTQAEVLRTQGTELCGFLVPPDDVHGWADAICQLSQDNQLRQKCVERARLRSADFTIEKMIDGFELAIMRATR